MTESPPDPRPSVPVPSHGSLKRNTAVSLTSQALSLFGSALVQYALMWHITLVLALVYAGEGRRSDFSWWYRPCGPWARPSTCLLSAHYCPRWCPQSP